MTELVQSHWSVLLPALPFLLFWWQAWGPLVCAGWRELDAGRASAMAGTLLRAARLPCRTGGAAGRGHRADQRRRHVLRRGRRGQGAAAGRAGHRRRAQRCGRGTLLPLKCSRPAEKGVKFAPLHVGGRRCRSCVMCAYTHDGNLHRLSAQLIDAGHGHTMARQALRHGASLGKAP